VLAFIKFLDLIELEQIVKGFYIKPDRETKLGHYKMLTGIVVLIV